MSNDDILIYDIETRTYGLPDPDRDNLRIFGCYSFKSDKYYLLTDVNQIQRIVNAHKFLVGFNNKGYDNPVLKRAGINMEYKIIIDLREIFVKRASGMKVDKGMMGDLLMEYSLDYISKVIGVVDEKDGKIEIDYRKFMKETWTEEETKEIAVYTKRDIEVTKKMYEWVDKYFESFKEFMSEKDIENKSYLTCSLATFAYKSICKAMKWPEEYNNIKDEDEERISGGYVAYPAGEKFEGKIFCLDFASLYPHIMIQCNIYGRKKEGHIDERPTWNGNGIWKVEGNYYSDKLSGVGELFKKWYGDRVVFKKAGDKKEYSIKIILNSSYGALDFPSFKQVYDKTAAGDVTRIGRQWIKFGRKVFRENGYQVIYTDTDSIYVLDARPDITDEQAKEKLMETKKKIMDYIKLSIPFPQDTFDMSLDYEIKYMWFFKGGTEKEEDDDMDADDMANKSLGFMKKNYLLVYKKYKKGEYIGDDVAIKNLGLRKKSNTPLSKKIFWEYLVPQIIKTGNCKFAKVYIKDLINELLAKDISLILMRKEVSVLSDYEKSPNCLSAQISKKYGNGIHFLIPNLKGVGIGKGKSYCTLDEFKQQGMKLSDIDLENVWNELDYFIKPQINKNIFDF
jgi:DNA polymerase elongation subunit (family B)